MNKQIFSDLNSGWIKFLVPPPDIQQDKTHVYLLDDPLAALMSSSERHSAMDLMFLKAASLAPVQRSQINSLTPDGSCSSNTSRVLAGTRVDNGVHNNLERVLASEKMDNLEGMLHNPHGHQLLTIVPAMHHERVAK